MHAAEFRRLSGITQVVRPDEGFIFHNRLTHTLEVAQLARRIAERLASESPRLKTEGHLDPDVVEAAALAHDLGHPPFGHKGEETLNRLGIEAAHDPDQDEELFDGFEGNAQSFRIVVRLAPHGRPYPGLNLTRATLNAILKYPWLRAPHGHKHRKFGAYRGDVTDFQFAREYSTEDDRSLEAEIMDFADTVAYSVHDVIDFWQAGLIPIAELAANPPSLDAVVTDWIESRASGLDLDAVQSAHEKDMFAIRLGLISSAGYEGTFRERAHLKTISATTIAEFVNSVSVEDGPRSPHLKIPRKVDLETEFLKRLVWHFVIDNRGLATQQYGQAKVLEFLYHAYLTAIRASDYSLIPPQYTEALLRMRGLEGHPKAMAEARLATDVVASMPDALANKLYRRLSGTDVGSVTEILEG